MNQPPRTNVSAAIGSGNNVRPKEIFPSQNDLKNLDRELEQRRRDALALVRENKLKNASSRVDLLE